MLKIYMEIAWRNLIRHKLFSLINVVGLSSGLAVCLLILIYVAHEFSFDRFHKNYRNISYLTEKTTFDGTVLISDRWSYATGEVLKRNVPTIAGYIRVRSADKPAIVENPELPGVKFTEADLLYADKNFFKVFTFRLIEGDADNVLTKPFSVVISSKMATKYFGLQDPRGKLLSIKTDSTTNLYQVTGVAENSPSNSSIVFNFVVSGASLRAQPDLCSMFKSQKVEGGNFKTYFVLDHPGDTGILQRYLKLSAKTRQFQGKHSYSLIPLADVHLTYGDTTDNKYLKIFPMAGGLILLLALVNYMSLSTARFAVRAKEIGVRKVAGADRKQIALQFYVESALVTIISFVLAYAICFLIKVSLLTRLGIQMDSSFLYSLPSITIAIFVLILTIGLAGSYPAFILSAYKPVATLTGQMSKSSGGDLARKFFTGVQFTISTGLIVCGIIMAAQLYFFRHTNTGISREDVIMIPVVSFPGNSHQQFKRQVSQLAGVKEIATSLYPMYRGFDVSFVHKKNSAETVPLSILSVDSNFIHALGIRWKILPPPQTDLAQSGQVILNETAVRKLNLSGNPVGQLLDFGGRERIKIAGIVKNFNISSLVYEVEPMGLLISADTAFLSKGNAFIYVRTIPHTNLTSLIDKIAGSFKEYDKINVFSYSFLDEKFNLQYKAEDQLATIFNAFTLIAIILAILGLFGLTAFSAGQRTKEIGIRKVLGASARGITALLSIEFMTPVGVAILIGCLGAWLTMQKWLENFAFRVEIHWWMFGIAALVSTVVATLTIFYHTLKAATANPVKSLRRD